MARTLVIIPAYNEAETISDVVDAIRRLGPAYSVVVVDDGSTDATAAIATRAGAEVIQLPYNLGIGGAMQTGYRYALRNDFDVAVQCDADGQHPVHQIPRLVARVLAGSADLVVGSRYVAASEYRPSFSRRIGKSL
ncbi:MAG: glycosyltransferase family 2 protein, partial [Candidatus Hydrogenedentales bacterium]